MPGVRRAGVGVQARGALSAIISSGQVAVPPFDETLLEQVANVLGATSSGLTGGEIGVLLSNLSIPDPSPTHTKRVRLYHALSMKQRQNGTATNVAAFIQDAMNPVRYHADPAQFAERRAALNTVLAFAGYFLREDGTLSEVPKAATLSEAEQRARRLEARLRGRGVHTDVLRFCRAELLQDNYFHAVFEATKSVADKIRTRAELTSDGSQLVDQAFSGDRPRLAINTLQTETELSEQRGFANLLKGMFGTFRNVTAHAPKIAWPIMEEDALDLLSLASYLHRRIDNAAPTRWS